MTQTSFFGSRSSSRSFVVQGSSILEETLRMSLSLGMLIRSFVYNTFFCVEPSSTKHLMSFSVIEMPFFACSGPYTATGLQVVVWMVRTTRALSG